MTNKFYHIYRSQADNFSIALEELTEAMAMLDELPIRITLFGKPANNDEYIEQRNRIEIILNERFANKPMMAYISQEPLCSTLAAEVMSIRKEEYKGIEYHDDYIVIDGREIISAGIHADTSQGIGRQAEDIFLRVDEILKHEGARTNDIVRQWNYIEQITHMGNDGQHYQLFNDARSYFYSSSNWDNGYPAATGIGAQTGGVVVVFDAIKSSHDVSTPIDNPLQISAHAYSQQVLINTIDKHKTTPKFERARHISGAEELIHISGTAAIRGEESCTKDIVGQTALTMENIDYLISKDNQQLSGVTQPTDMEYRSMRVYIKHKENLCDAKAWMTDNYPTVPTLYLWADICRDELLIEIEGIATQIVK